MKWFHDLKIATKLMLSFVVVLVLTVLLGVASMLRMAELNRATTDLSGNWMPSVKAVLTMRTQLGDFRRWEAAHLLTSEHDKMGMYEKRLVDTQAAIKKTDEEYAKLISSPEEQAEHDAFLKAWEKFLAEDVK